jgi:MoaA/NifB/PqqE/SkfB family radical SAM enzyme
VRVKSNGHALHGELARRLRDEVDPFVVEVSLHGASAETHDRQTRVPGSFVRLIANLHEMIELGLRVKINSTLTSGTKARPRRCTRSPTRSVCRCASTCRSRRATTGSHAAQCRADGEGIRELMRVEDARLAAAYAEGHQPTPLNQPADFGGPTQSTVKIAKHCGAGSAGIAIDPYGNVYPCVQWRRAVANLHERSISDVWGHAFDGIPQETEEAKASWSVRIRAGSC